MSVSWLGDHVALDVEQLGDGHVVQAALVSDTRIDVGQQGAGQYATVSQLGEGNGLSLRQSGQGNRATIQQ
ncbi:hypothetical protein [Pseudomonas sp. EpS/L25]|uniref:hypothetical protein n=1 Tax=Pseudomonas sp. EpS/L25 TaxID=1749078 RepID=UPI0007443BF6|nr:hypothetical protein [Pseudomonas sp. EpS/L25]KUM42849.1 hypothetical protein AR540_03490 [Pseudomonas sp. EpS/L25]